MNPRRASPGLHEYREQPDVGIEVNDILSGSSSFGRIEPAGIELMDEYLPEQGDRIIAGTVPDGCTAFSENQERNRLVAPIGVEDLSPVFQMLCELQEGLRRVQLAGEPIHRKKCT